MMKRMISDDIHVVMYLYPLIYTDSSVMCAVTYDKVEHKYHTDVNPLREINGPLSGPGESLSNPIADEWDSFIEDCKFLIDELGFTTITTHRSLDSKKSEYVFMLGMKGEPCGSLIFDLRISDHPFDAKFPEEMKPVVLDYLKLNNILDGTATEAGIDFQVESVLVGGVKNDSWDRAFNRLYEKLRMLRRKVRVRLNTRGET